MCIRDSSYTNINTNLEILRYLPKGRKLNTTEPVSYTHLDVYKRQDLWYTQKYIKEQIKR